MFKRKTPFNADLLQNKWILSLQEQDHISHFIQVAPWHSSMITIWLLLLRWITQMHFFSFWNVQLNEIQSEMYFNIACNHKYLFPSSLRSKLTIDLLNLAWYIRVFLKSPQLILIPNLSKNSIKICTYHYCLAISFNISICSFIFSPFEPAMNRATDFCISYLSQHFCRHNKIMLKMCFQPKEDEFQPRQR